MNLKRVRTVFFGTADFAVPSLEALIIAPFTEIVAVITQPDRPRGRSGTALPSPVAATAQQHGLPLHKPEKLAPFFETFQATQPELAVVVAYGKILPESYLQLPRYGFVNVHASLLPRHRGAAPIQYTILSGDREGGITIQQVAPAVDSGAILGVKKIPLDAQETSATLSAKLMPLGATLLSEVLPAYLAGTLSPQPQDESQVTMTKKISKEDGVIDWHKPAQHIDREIRAFTPWPGSSTTVAGQTMKILAAHTIAASSNMPEVGIMHLTPENQLAVRCGTDALQIVQLQLPGKKPMSADSFLNGYRHLITQK